MNRYNLPDYLKYKERNTFFVHYKNNYSCRPAFMANLLARYLYLMLSQLPMH